MIGASSLGRMTTVLPTAMAMAVARAANTKGAFQGMIARTTPAGLRRERLSVAGWNEGSSSPTGAVVKAAASRRVAAASCTFIAAQAAVLPVSNAKSARCAPASSSNNWAALSRTDRRWSGPVADHPENALAAAATASLASSTPPAATCR